MPTNWERGYGYLLLLFETLVDAQFRGTSYQAGNWTIWGRRAVGAGWTSITTHGHAVKRIYVYPPSRDVQRRLTQASAPRWIPWMEA